MLLTTLILWKYHRLLWNRLPTWLWRLQSRPSLERQMQLFDQTHRHFIVDASIITCRFAHLQGDDRRAMWQVRKQKDMQGLSMGELLFSVQLLW